MSNWLWFSAFGFVIGTQFLQLFWLVQLTQRHNLLRIELESLRRAHDGLLRLLTVPSRDTDHLLE